METFSNSQILSVLRSGNARRSRSITDGQRDSGSASQPKTLDIQQCLANIPHFLRTIESAKEKASQSRCPIRYIIDENYMNSIKVLIQPDASSTGNKQGKQSAGKNGVPTGGSTGQVDIRKQWLGFLLISKTFDPQICQIEEQLFTKNINVLLHSISNIVNKADDVLSDLAVVVISAWQTLLQLLSHMYDQRQHQASLLVLKSICPAIIRKLDKLVQKANQQYPGQEAQFFMENSKHIPFKIIMNALLECVKLFPSSFKQIVGAQRSNGPNTKDNLMRNQKGKDQVGALIEDIIRIFLKSCSSISEIALRLLCQLSYKAKDKSKVHYGVWLTRCMQNLSLYLDAVRPRLFSDAANSVELNKPLPIHDICFAFIFDPQSSLEREDLNKFTIKDMREQMKDIEMVKKRIETLFDALEMTLGKWDGSQTRAHQMAAQGVEMMTVQVNIQELLESMKQIALTSPNAFGDQMKSGQQFDESQLICGLGARQYREVITLAKYRCLGLLPVIFERFGNVSLPFVVKDIPVILKQMMMELSVSHSNLPALTSNFNRVLDLYMFGNELLKVYGLNSIHGVRLLYFNDLDHFNIITIFVNLIRCIVQKRDQTVIDLQLGNQSSLGLGSGGMLKSGKVLQKASGQSESESLANAFMQVDCTFLEDNYLQPVLDVMMTISSSKLFLYLTLPERVRFQNSVCFNILSIAGLKSSQSLSLDSTMVKIVEIVSNLIRNCNQADLTIQNDMIQALIQFKNKMVIYAGSKNDYSRSYKLINTLSRVIEVDLNGVVAPRKQEKFQIATNTLTHLQMHQQSLFIHQNKQLIKTYLTQQKQLNEIPANQQSNEQNQIEQKAEENIQDQNEIQNPEKIDLNDQIPIQKRITFNDENQINSCIQADLIEAVKIDHPKQIQQNEIIQKTPIFDQKEDPQMKDDSSNSKENVDDNKEKMELPQIVDESDDDEDQNQ